jgi:predicted  nucleic acid-binding Zn-ribbon protein
VLFILEKLRGDRMNNEQDIQDIKERLVRIETLLETNNGKVELELKALEEKIKVANHRIEDLESTITWLWRAIIGAVVGGAIALLFK